MVDQRAVGSDCVDRAAPRGNHLPPSVAAPIPSWIGRVLTGNRCLVLCGSEQYRLLGDPGSSCSCRFDCFQLKDLRESSAKMVGEPTDTNLVRHVHFWTNPHCELRRPMVDLCGVRRSISGESTNLVRAYVHHCKSPLWMVGWAGSPCHT